MYIDAIRFFVKNIKELESLIQTIRIKSKDIGVELEFTNNEDCVYTAIQGVEEYVNNNNESWSQQQTAVKRENKNHKI